MRCLLRDSLQGVSTVNSPLGECEARHPEETDQEAEKATREDRTIYLTPPTGKEEYPMWRRVEQEMANVRDKKTENEDTDGIADAQR